MPAQIDVLIPVYNAAKTIRSAVESIQAQTVRDIRIVAVDDGSTDGTGAILAEMAAADPRIHLHTKANGGIVDALNDGLNLCSAPLVARMDADDLAHPDRLQVQADYLRDNPDCVAVGSAVRAIGSDGELLGHDGVPTPPEYANASWIPSRQPYLIHPTLLARREDLLAVGGYRYAFHSEDSDLYWRLSDRGRLHNLVDPLLDYRHHEASVSSKSVLNGRISAINSELAAISARRRAAGRPDIDFPKSLLERYTRARSITPICDVAARQLDPEERDYLERAVAAKLVELMSYRPFRPDAEDCAFIREHFIAEMPKMGVQNYKWSKRSLMAFASVLVQNGRWSNFIQLFGLRAGLPLVAKIVFWIARSRARKLLGVPDKILEAPAYELA